MPKYTTEELIQFLYEETNDETSRAIQKAVEEDWSLQEKLEALKESKDHLDTILASPRPQSVMAILNYARKSAEVEQP